ncbi:hypothetical protein H0H81_009041 [Sphagnurus paluster]|uniref:homogentisate 1,2-dioxygenase n=1 Tax=Sphagnurus paluster TaxID=117069 RepID=A0A9P7GMP8_9AGAR|nr:hypothetical protein H0H81_009041 [Sphagnurus paluster]
MVLPDHFVRIPLILAIDTAFHVAFTSPASPPSKAQLHDGGQTVEKIVFSAITPRFYIAKALHHTAVFTEILIILLPSWFLNEGVPVLLNLHLTPPIAIGAFLAIVGGLLRFWCYKTLDQYHTFNLAIMKNHRLITTGPYSVVRHPSYTGGAAIVVGSMFWFWSPGSLMMEHGGMFLETRPVLSTMYVLALLGSTLFGMACVGALKSRMREEDAMLKDRFGKEWEDWARNLVSNFLPLNPKVHTSPTQLGWQPFDLPADEASVDFVDGLKTIAGNGDPTLREGFAIHVYLANASMKKRAFCKSDGDFLVIPQLGRLDIQTEFGRIMVRPGELFVIQRGLKFKVNAFSRMRLNEFQHADIQEIFGSHYVLPELGPLGANGLANPRDFEFPLASFDIDQSAWNIAGTLFNCAQDHTPFDVVAWHGK